jgi:anaerobic carbon-monoxide dehydrogenase iron sulfur subunit
MRRLIVDPDACVGCESCAMRCSLEKTGTVNPAWSRVQIVKLEVEGVNIPLVCHHCDDARCVQACPLHCIVRNEASGEVRLVEEVCNGCRLCVQACLYAGPKHVPRPSLHPGVSSAIKVLCDLCDGHPACVPWCPTGAIRFRHVDEAVATADERARARVAEFLARRR